MVSASKTTSWAVAAGVAAVEALKDQMGLCRWNYAFRTLQQHAKSNIGSSLKSSSTQGVKSNTANQARKFSGVIDHSSSWNSMNNIREAEKAENVMHLVCWGPR